ncbi:MAG: helix-turn-helix transcriptional regulator [Bacteroidota bacterium]
MPLQLNIFLLLFGGLQGLLLSLFLVRKKLHRSAYIFLLLYFGVLLLQITLKIMSKSWLREHWHFLYDISYFLPLLYGPLIFLFVRQLLLNRNFRPLDLLHLLPFAFLSLYLLLVGRLSFYNHWESIFYSCDTGLLLQLLSLLTYHWLALQCWNRYRNSLQGYFSETQQLQVNWIRQFIIASLAVCVIIAAAIYLLYINYPRGAEYRYGFAALTIFIYWISYTALTQPSVFSVIKGYGGKENAVTSLLPKLVVHRPAKKYSNSGLSEEDVITIREALQKLMPVQKPYLNPELTINDLALLAKCNRHHLSQVLNEGLQRSFYDYVNHYRVEEARQLLLDPAKEGHKIASIAYDAGFNSLSTFNEVFKKMTGATPSQFRKDLSRVSKQQRG